MFHQHGIVNRPRKRCALRLGKRVNVMLLPAVLMLFMLALNSSTLAQAVASPYQIATWQGFRQGAVSFTFDDNCPNQLAIAIPMFNKFGFKVTLFTVTSPKWAWPANWTGLQKAALEGHEIASHTIDHPNFDTLSDSALRAELSLSQDTINAYIKGQKCITLAYPYCVPGNEAMDARYYIAARGCSGQIVSKTPADFMNISSFVCGDKGLNTVAALESEADKAAASQGWCVYLIHGINGTEPGAYSPISQDTIQATLQYLNSHRDKFWVAPFGAVVRYVRERDSAKVVETYNHGDSIMVQLADNLDTNMYDVPITLRRELPADWDSVVVSQNGEALDSRIVSADTAKYVIFDAAPNKGDIIIFKESRKSIGTR
jgi:peptidoglycan/xylan/chitin deacetylase (PgdA/CDA1 family)